MKLFHLLGFTKELVSITKDLVFVNFSYETSFVFVCFLDGPCFFKEPAGIACYAFEAFSIYSRGCILLE